MVLLDLMDTIVVHAKAAAITASGAKFYDVAVGFPAAKGKCVRIFYGGERAPEHFTADQTLTSKLVAQAITVRAYWPVSDTGVKQQRATEGEMAVFVKDLRTRIEGDADLNSNSVDLRMHLAVVDQVVISSTQYAVVDIEIGVDIDEYTRSK